MIDTVKIKIPVDKNLANIIRSKSRTFTSKDEPNNSILFKVAKHELFIPSYSRDITIFCSNDDHVTLEFSAPKLFGSHNVYILPSSQLATIFEHIYNRAIEKFGSFPHFDLWRIQRLDLCYNWKMGSREKAIRTINILSNYNYLSKKKSIYENESVTYSGGTYLKIYLKHPEYLKHDFKEMIKHSQKQIELAHELLDYSEDILRFEVELRSKELQRIFDKKVVTYKDISDKLCLDQLNKYFKNLVKFDISQIMSTKEIYKTLVDKYGKTEGTNLYTFWNLLNSDNPIDQLALKELKKGQKTTYYLRINKLKKANIGLNIRDYPSDNIELSIPSKNSSLSFT